MFVKMKNKNIAVLNFWPDTDLNKERVKAWGLDVYTGEIEEVTNFKLKIIKGHANDFNNPILD